MGVPVLDGETQVGEVVVLEQVLPAVLDEDAVAAMADVVADDRCARGVPDRHAVAGLGDAQVAAPVDHVVLDARAGGRSEEHTSELQAIMRISYAAFCLKKKNMQTVII